jgi:Polyketide cyclase / dehydrase and lipid transport
MSINAYELTTHWRVSASVEEVYDIISDASQLNRWWPDVYLKVDVLAPGDARGVGKHVRLLTKGRLPYTLRWEFTTIDARRPSTLILSAHGDFEGTGAWSFEQDGEWVNVGFDWRVRVEKLPLRCFSFPLKPIFAANHRWAMARGEERLKLELNRRRCEGE